MGSDTPNLGIETEEWLLKKRLDELGPMFRACWDNYLKFYTVFLTFNLAAMAWLSQRNDGQMTHRRTIAGVFIGLTLLCSVTSASVALYTRKVSKDHLLLENALRGTERTYEPLKAPSPFPTELAMYAGFANCLAMVGMAWVWVAIGFL